MGEDLQESVNVSDWGQGWSVSWIEDESISIARPSSFEMSIGRWFCVRLAGLKDEIHASGEGGGVKLMVQALAAADDRTSDRLAVFQSKAEPSTDKPSHSRLSTRDGRNSRQKSISTVINVLQKASFHLPPPLSLSPWLALLKNYHLQRYSRAN